MKKKKKKTKKSVFSSQPAEGSVAQLLKKRTAASDSFASTLDCYKC